MSTQSDQDVGVQALVAYLQQQLGWEAAFVPGDAETEAVQAVIEAADGTSDQSINGRQTAGEAALREGLDAAGYGDDVTDQMIIDACTAILQAVAANRAKQQTTT